MAINDHSVHFAPLRTLRERAEEMLRLSPAEIAGMSAEDFQALAHELQVHQMQLEIQNEELRHAQVALAESRDRYSDLYEFAPVGYVTMNQDGRIVAANLTATRMLSVDRQKLLHAKLANFVAPQFRDTFHQHRREAFSTGLKQICELVMHTPDRKFLWVRLESIAFGSDTHFLVGHEIGSALRDENAAIGSPVDSDRECQTVLIDITEQKRLEEEVKRQMQRLKEGDRRKDSFIATLAHELRNPLAPIRNAVEVLRENPGKSSAGADLKWASEVIDRQVSHLSRLVDDLLDVSRATRDQLELKKQKVLLTEVIDSAEEASRPLIDEHGDQLSITLPLQPVYLHADKVRLTQVFTNLLHNAAKYTPRAGRITVKAELHNPAYSFPQVIVSVADDGVGIQPDHLPHIFDTFYQVDRSDALTQGGLGLGLTLVKRLVEMHDGSVEAHSGGADRGSEFIVRLPVLVEPPEAQKPAPAPKKKLTGRRILVVDDYPNSAESFAWRLRRDGNEVQTALDGRTGIEVAERFHPDLILLDIGMPKLNGYEVAREIRAGPWCKEIALMAMTGWGQQEDRPRSREAGFDGHMTKP